MKERIIIFDLLKLLAIFLVVWGHCLQHLLDVPATNNPIFMWITTFHMPLFMFLSGFFSVKTLHERSKLILKKRSKQLLLPWLVWSVIILLFLYLIDGQQSLKDILFLFFNSLWFLKSLFVCGLLGLVAFKPVGNRYFWIFLSFLMSQICLVWNVFTMYPCFLFGIICFKHFDFIKCRMDSICIISGCLFLCLSVYLAFTPSFWIRGLGIREALFNGNISVMNNLSFLTILILKRYVQVFVGIVGSFFWVTLFYRFSNLLSNKVCSKLADWGQCTLGVYMIQTVVVEIIMPRLILMSKDYMVIFNFVMAPLLSIVVVCISVWITIRIQRQGGCLSMILLGK